MNMKSFKSIHISGVDMPLFAVIYLMLLIALLLFNTPNVSGDSIALIQGSKKAINCIVSATLINCNASSADTTVITHFPLSQHIPSFLMTFINVSLDHQLLVFSLINIISFIFIILLMFCTLIRISGPTIAYFQLLILITGPLAWYAYSTFGEMLAAFLISLFTIAVLLRCHWFIIAVTLMIAGFTKETAIPFLLIIGVLSLFISPQYKDDTKRKPIIGMIVGTLLTLLFSFLFNIFKYGSVINEEYNRQLAINPPNIGQVLQNFVGLILAPSGGIVEFWPIAASVILIGIIIGITSLMKRRYYQQWLPGVTVFVVLLFMIVGFSLWAFPFGWVAWGPRFIIPWIPTLVLMLLIAYKNQVKNIIYIITRGKREIICATIIIGALTLPQVGVLMNTQSINKFFSPDAVCQQVTTVDMGAYYYKCINYLAWNKKPIMIESISGLGNPLGLVFGVTYIVMIYSMLNVMRRTYDINDY